MNDGECDLVKYAWDGISSPGHPFHSTVMVCGAVAVLSFVVSTLSGNYSQVDKIWSILPVVYTWMLVCNSRTLLMAALVTLWGVRLSWNFNRRGGYTWPLWQGGEDYRWEILKKGEYIGILSNPVAWVVFNIVFISFYQNLLLLLMVSPSALAFSAAQLPSQCYPEGSHLHTGDVLVTIAIVSLIVIESIADNQQYAFQTEKYRLRSAGGKSLTGNYADGFCQSGLYSILRKPNYAAEQAIWVCFYLFSVIATLWLNWSIVGCILLVLLFQGSGDITEKATRAKYPKYVDYRKRVPLYVPFLLYQVDKKTA
jgi:steroid 5-alpha reductase family enzyme